MFWDDSTHGKDQDKQKEEAGKKAEKMQVPPEINKNR